MKSPADYPKSRPTKSETKNAKPESAPAALSMPPMSLVAPLLIEDANTTNILSIVHVAATEGTASVAIVDAQGLEVLKFSVPVPSQGQKTVPIADELRKAGIAAPVAGSLIVTPKPSNMTIAGQLSILRKNTFPVQYVEEELPMLDASRKNVFQSLATGATGQPIVAVRSVSRNPETLTASCLVEGEMARTVQQPLLPNQWTLLVPCGEGHAAATLDERLEGLFDKPKVIGLSISATGLPGNVAMFGIAPRNQSGSLIYEPLQFRQTGTLSTFVDVFPGVPLGPTAPLRGLDYQPEIAAANMGSSPATVSVVASIGASGSPEKLGDFTIPPLTSIKLPLDHVAGDPQMANSIRISGNVPEGQVITNLRSLSTADPGRFVEIPNQSNAKPTNGGQHPWSLKKDSDATLVLFNGDPSPIKPTIRVYSGKQEWAKQMALPASATLTLDLRNLFQEAVKDSEARVLKGVPDQGLSGIVAWSSFTTQALHGRLMQSDNALMTNRNFSCPEVYIICGAAFTYPNVSLTVGSTFTEEGTAIGCPGYSGCSCDSGFCPNYGSDVAPYYYWTSWSPDVLSFSGTTTSSSTTLYGSGAGTSAFYLTASDYMGCGGQGDGNATVSTPQCFAQLKYRSVYVGPINTGGNHAFWWYQTSSSSANGGHLVTEGGPSGDCASDCGYLMNWRVSGDTGHYTDDNSEAATAWSAALSSAACVGVDKLDAFASTWSQNSIQYQRLGPNSNTYAHRAGTAGGFNPTTPPSAPGW